MCSAKSQQVFLPAEVISTHAGLLANSVNSALNRLMDVALVVDNGQTLKVCASVRFVGGL